MISFILFILSEKWRRMNTPRWIADRAAQIEVSGIRKVFELGRSLKDPINLSIGQPHFPVPDPVKAACKAAIDAVYTAIGDSEGLAAECEDAAATGFTAKACIHPAQVSSVRAAFAPTNDEVADARELLAEAERRPGVFTWRGAMVDEPILRHARAVVARAAAGR